MLTEIEQLRIQLETSHQLGRAREKQFAACREERDRLREICLWQPINTAPRDGTRILVCGGTCEDSESLCPPWQVSEPMIVYWDRDYWFGGYAEGYDHSLIVEPTHWMPFPKPPVQP